jgi:hypothetical protein
LIYEVCLGSFRAVFEENLSDAGRFYS